MALVDMAFLELRKRFNTAVSPTGKWVRAVRRKGETVNEYAVELSDGSSVSVLVEEDEIGNIRLRLPSGSQVNIPLTSLLRAN